ncbi:MAG: YaaA family protein [Crenarchaeota archaeon]|nr:YaaA family protein [Thermoproteota archaeon]
MNKTLFIIPCTAVKNPQDKYYVWKRESSIVSRLRNDLSDDLMKQRRYVAENVEDQNRRGYFHSMNPGPDLGYDVQSYNVGYLPAYERYSWGRTYRCLPSGFWNGLIINDSIDALFISGLYGVARYTEYIRNYNIEITQKTIRGEPVYSIWSNIIPKVIAGYAEDNEFKKVVILTSKKYRFNMMPSLEWYLRRMKIHVEVPYLGKGSNVLNNICYELRNRVENMLGSPKK